MTVTLTEAIDEVNMHHHGTDYTWDEIDETLDNAMLEAIATILNAVVKGELKCIQGN